MFWFSKGCMRDECGYRDLARKIVDGEGLVTMDSWLWAPGYPYIVATFLFLFGSVYAVKGLQVVVAVLTTLIVAGVADRIADRRTARIAAFLFAFHPTMAFYATRMWSEALYAAVLMLAVLCLLWSREGSWRRGILPGLMIAGCVLFRGVATYMAPIFVLAAIWPDRGVDWRASVRKRWRHAAAMIAALVITVAPYSWHASRTHGALIISDATLGQMMWLGNNDFPPLTYDYGPGYLRGRTLRKWTSQGRPHCPKELSAGDWNRCEVNNGVEWIQNHPGQFLRRVPVRLAQLFNPHTFLTRHIRLGKWQAMPWLLKEGVCLWVVLWSYLVLLGGTLGAWSKARGPAGVLMGGIVGYHVLAVAMLAGLSRYRLPLEPLWILYASLLIAHPRATWRSLMGSTWRSTGALITFPLLLMLVSWYLRAGFPGF